MFAGHFGLAAAVKAQEPKTPLWALMLGTQLLDVIFVPLYLTGVETIVSVSPVSYGGSVIHADYTHSLVGALIISLIAAWLAGRRWGKRSGMVIGATVFSHWLLDLLVHRGDLPILPGNIGGLPLLGFGLWRFPVVSIVLESLLVIAGGYLYARSVVSVAGHGRKIPAIAVGSVMAIMLVLSLLTDVFGVG